MKLIIDYPEKRMIYKKPESVEDFSKLYAELFEAIENEDLVGIKVKANQLMPIIVAEYKNIRCPRCAAELKMVEDLPGLQIFTCAECKLKITCEESAPNSKLIEKTREIMIWQSKHRSIKKTVKMIDVEEHGHSYAWIQGQFWGFPMYQDDTVETKTDCACVVEESPKASKPVHEEVLRKLGVDVGIIEHTIEDIGYY